MMTLLEQMRRTVYETMLEEMKEAFRVHAGREPDYREQALIEDQISEDMIDDVLKAMSSSL